MIGYPPPHTHRPGGARRVWWRVEGVADGAEWWAALPAGPVAHPRAVQVGLGSIGWLVVCCTTSHSKGVERVGVSLRVCVTACGMCVTILYGGR